MSEINYQKFFSKFPEIHLGNILLRDMLLSDVNGYYSLMKDPNVIQYLSDEDVPNSSQESLEEIKFWSGLFYKKVSIFWGVATQPDDELIGTIGFNSWSFNNKRAEISYELRSDHWRKGIMTKAATNILTFGFKEMGLNRIEVRTMVHNIPSQNLLNKLGFKEEGIQRSYRMIRGQPQDIKLYSILKEDYGSFLI